jgi:hypothetical protein
MNINKRMSANSVLALKDALVAIYFRKKDLRQFIELTIENTAIISTIDWNDNVKFESVSQLIDRMIKRQDFYQTDLLKLVQEVGNMNDFSHLDYWEKENKGLIKKAEIAVNKLRQQAKGHFEIIEELKKAEERRDVNKEKLKESIDYQQKLDALKMEFYEIASNTNSQQKGFQFEKFLNKLFTFFDLDPKSAFKVIGEQIDGAFTFDNTDYLLEAKWQEKSIIAADLYTFGGKIQGKLKNTLGLFISLGPYSSECTKTGSPVLKSMILMDGMDLMQILEGRIRLNDIILIKRRHASQTGDIYYQMK